MQTVADPMSGGSNGGGGVKTLIKNPTETESQEKLEK
jgi:hypothetical protein